MANKELIVKVFEGSEVFFIEDGWFNATIAAKRFEKDPVKWTVSDEVLEYGEALAKSLNLLNPTTEGLLDDIKNCQFDSAKRVKIPKFLKEVGLLNTKRGSPENGGGTWLHPKLGVAFARWLSADFAVWCDIQIEQIIKEQSQQPFMPRGYPQMLEAARNDWKAVRNELIGLLGIHLNIHDRKRKSQFTNQVYLDLIETTARRLRDHFSLTRPNQLTRDYLHQLVQESIVEIEIRLSDALKSGSITSWPEFKDELEQLAERVRYMKELQNGRVPLPRYAYPNAQNVQTQ